MHQELRNELIEVVRKYALFYLDRGRSISVDQLHDLLPGKELVAEALDSLVDEGIVSLSKVYYRLKDYAKRERESDQKAILAVMTSLPASMSAISKASGVPSSRVGDVLNELLNQGVINFLQSRSYMEFYKPG